MMEWVLAGYLVLVCLGAALTDLKSGKIYNRFLKAVALPGIALDVIYYAGHRGTIPVFLTNLAAAIAISLLFYGFQIWGAGDAKLWILGNFLFPAGWYVITEKMIFPSMIILMLVFIEAYLYVLAESAVLLIVRKDKGISMGGGGWSADQIWNMLFSVIWLSLIYLACDFFLGAYYRENQIFFALLGLLAANKMVDLKIPHKKVLVVLGGTTYVILVWLRGGSDFFTFLWTAAVVGLSIGAMHFSRRYNYSKIPTSTVKEGMILSFMTVGQFAMSRIKGLPQTTDETTRSRITAAEAEAVRRWENSRYGAAEVIIVRHVPFGIFILIGIITYITGVFLLQ